MGREAALKDLRKQLRNVVQEELPNIVTNELFTKLQEKNAERLEAISASVRKTLDDMDSRSKDVQNFIMRQMTSDINATPVVAPEAPQPTPAQ